ncbi:Retrovirus-related Pol polyprotein from transposon RE1 [Linum perenne]
MVRGNPSSVFSDRSDAPLIGVDHPFYIGANDNPGVMLVSTVLSGPSDYFSWARSMKRALMTKNKIGFVDGSRSPPDSSDSTYSAWERANMLVLGWLNKAMAPEIAQSVLWLDSARDVWVDLEERFSRSSLVRINDLHDQISNFRQGSLSVSAYYTRFKLLWDEYMMFRPLPCTCNALSLVRGYYQSEQIIRFLRGLNPGFAAVRSQIIRTEPLPTINQVFSMISQEEQELGIPSSSGGVTNGTPQVLAATGDQSSGSASQAFAVAQQNFRRGGTKRPYCTFCGLIGHTIEKCYKKVGYPPGYQKRARVVNAVQSSNPVVQTSIAAVQSSIPASGGSSSEEGSGGVTISQEQYRSLYSLFQGHGSATQVLGPNIGFASCVTRSRTSADNTPVTSEDAPYIPTSTQEHSSSVDVPTATNQDSAQFTDDWYS